MRKLTLFIFVLVCLCARANEVQRYVGGDISMLPLYEQHNSGYKDANGKKIDNLLDWFIAECGWNTFRVRLFVNPDKTDPSLSQDLEYVTTLGQRIKAAGAHFMLDLHYSDTWVDATHIQPPASWKGSDDATMAQHVAEYTRQVLTALSQAGATPDFVQAGNEIMYGLCGIKVAPYNRDGDNWSGYLMLLKEACNAIREICPEAKIIIHTDRPGNREYNNFYYKKLTDNGVDFDIIGLSYYPFWHGYLTDEQVKSKSDKNNLVKAIKQLATDFPDKRVHIVECAYNFQYWPDNGVNYDTRDIWPCSKTGQYNFVKDLVDALKPLDNVDGINYWFPEEAGNGDDTDWKTSQGTVLWTWQNRGFWDENVSSSGHAINRTGQITGDKTPADVCAPYYMGVFVDFIPQGIERTKEEQKCHKTLIDGQLVIEYNQQKYDILGHRLK